MEFYTCIAKYAFFGIRDEKLLATARKSWYHSMVCSGIEAVITGLTRNLLPLLLPQILQTLVFQALRRFCKSSYFRLFYPVFLSCSRPCFLGDFKIE